MTNVVIVDVKGVITKSSPDVLFRHVQYADALARLDSKSRLIILSRNKGRYDLLSKNIEIISEKSLLNYFRKGFKLFRSLNENTLLVSGDPWESYLASLILRKFTSKHLPIQVQLHADVGSSSWRSLNGRNRIRALFLSYSLNRAETIRCVSTSQLTNLERISPGVSSKTEVIPVPIQFDYDLEQNKKRQKKVAIAIVGRIHKDRGLEEFVRICKILKKSFRSLKIYVIGEGPHEEWLRTALQKDDLLKSSIFTGQMNQKELSLMWKNFGCIASLAPSEAYGRSARESLVYGVPVLATRSSGLVGLEEVFGGNGIWFLDGLDDKQVTELFKRMTGFIVPDYVRDSIINEVKSLDDELAKSWIKGSRLHRQTTK